jgi:hypothetical protein
MKINKILVISILLVAFAANAQITKGYWMMGGSGSFSNNKVTIGGNTVDNTELEISPNIGYFFIDKLAIGTSSQFNYVFPKADSKVFPSNIISPFVRYYFLKTEKPINVFSEISYEMIRNGHSDIKSDKFKIKAGTVFFLNSSVGIEVALNYSNQKLNIDYQNRAIYLDVGFQIHLEKK